MGEDIHEWVDGRYTLMFDEHTFFVWDNEKEERMTALEVTKKLNEQDEKLQVSDGSLVLLIDMILLGDVDELIKRTRECARQVAEQFDKFTKEELEDAVKENTRLRELFDDE